jgi:hypothetical protein
MGLVLAKVSSMLTGRRLEARRCRPVKAAAIMIKGESTTTKLFRAFYVSP